jgi:amino acid adenylation domain-containing protein
VAGRGKQNLKPRVAGENAAYLVYTSGSTGQPKGVVISHRNLVSYLAGTGAALQLRSSDRFLQFSALGFCVVIEELFATWMAGASVVLVNEVPLLAGKGGLSDVIRRNEVSVVELVSSYWHSWMTQMRESGEQVPEQLRMVLVGGERTKADLVREWREKSNAELVAIYGVTEATVTTTVGRTAASTEIRGELPIGRAIEQSRVYVLDEQMEPAPVGVKGELYIGGEQVARGYWNRADQTAERFVPDSVSGEIGKRLYRTGDVVRFVGQGELEYVGRIDEQVKVRGCRVETGEVETVLSSHQRVSDAVVIARQDKEGQDYLVAYVVPSVALNGDKSKAQDGSSKWTPHAHYPDTTLFLSHGEYGIYDELLYHAMVADELRNRGYRTALNRLVKSKRVVDVGTGGEALLARFCIEAGAEYVYAIEISEEAYRQAQACIAEVGLQDKIKLIHGDARKVELPERVDICVSELIGSIGSGEGGAVILNSARRWLKKGGAMIPPRCTTLISAVSLPERIRRQPELPPVAKHYVKQAYEDRGEQFDLRICISHFPQELVLSEAAVFEELDFNGELLEEQCQRGRVEIKRDGWMDGFLVWIRLVIDEGYEVDALSDECGWLPLYVPAFDEPLEVRAGDWIELACDTRISDDGLHPDYMIKGKVCRSGGVDVEVECDLSHHGRAVEQREFYKKLYASLGNGSAHSSEIAESAAQPKLTSEELRSFLQQQLPDYMVPSAIVMLDQLPLNTHGKVAVEQLPIPSTGDNEDLDESPQEAIEEVVAGIWSEVLGVERVGRRANFFSLGGHSLQAMRVVARVRDAFQIDLPLARFLDAPSLADFALNIEKALQNHEELRLPPLERVSREQTLPLSFAQQRLWFIHQLNPQSAAYNMRHAVRLRGQLDVDALERALVEIVKRHEILRTTFATVEGEPVQVISESIPVHLLRKDFSQLSETEREEATRRFTSDEVRQPFNLAEGPLLRPVLIRLSEDEHVLLFVMHHIISDGWSTDILAQELGKLYEALVHHEPPTLPELPIQYADFAYWQRNCLQGETLEGLLSYWKKQLAGELTVLDLPTDRPRTTVQSLRGERQNKMLSPGLLESLKSLSKRESVTLFMTLLGAFETLLYRYTGQEELLVGTPIANRNHVTTERLIGFFINTLVLRTHLSGRTGFRELLRHVREVTLGAYAHQDLPFERLVEEIQPQRNLGRMPLFQVMFMLQNEPVPQFEHLGLRLSPMEAYSGATEFDLVLNTIETDEGLLASITYNSDLFDATTIERMLNHYQVLLEGIVAEPNQSLALLPILTPVERNQLLEEWNDIQDYTQDKAIHELFEAQVERAPNAPALSFDGQQMSYAALNQAGNRIAHGLLQMGVAKSTPIAVMLDSGPLHVMSLLGILKTGCHFVCLDPEYPESRLKMILSQVNPSCLIAAPALLEKQSSLIEQVGKESPCHIVAIDQQTQTGQVLLANWMDGSHLFQTGATSNPGCEVSPGDLAYIVFTSGSTGEPKGIMQTHESFCQFIEWQSRQFQIEAPRRIAQWAASTYDASYAEIFATLCFGATLCLASSEVKVDPTAVVEWARRERISLLQVVPSFCRQVLHVLEAEQNPLPDLEFMLLAGEVLPVELTQSWYALFPESRPALFNLYGPTESVLATYYRVSEADTRRHLIPVGRAIPGRQILILDQQKQLCPIGVKGEIYIRSKYLTAGYFQNPRETQEVFVQNPLHKEYFDKVYRTRDLGRWLPDGNVEFNGRIDHQVKVRGMRIELEEIEAVLSRHTSVRQCVVAVADEDRLIAWVATSENVSPQELRGFMKEWLPDHMIPSAFIFVSELPLLPSGKIDRQALSLSDTGLAVAGAAQYVAPQTALEVSLAESWMALLHLERVGVDDNFFELGGHSLLATQALNKIRQLCGVELPLRGFFETPTIAGLAAKLEPLIQLTDEQRLARAMEQVKHLSDEEVDEVLKKHANISAH